MIFDSADISVSVGDVPLFLPVFIPDSLRFPGISSHSDSAPSSCLSAARQEEARLGPGCLGLVWGNALFDKWTLGSDNEGCILILGDRLDLHEASRVDERTHAFPIG